MDDNQNEVTQKEPQDPVIAVAPTSTPTPLPTITTADEWRRRAKARWLITLPSTATVKVRRPDFGRLVADGVIDAQQLIDMPTGGSPASNYTKLLPLARAVVPYIVIEPVVVAATNGHAPENALPVDDVPESDLIALFLWAGGWTTIPAIELVE